MHRKEISKSGFTIIINPAVEFKVELGFERGTPSATPLNTIRPLIPQIVLDRQYNITIISVV